MELPYPINLMGIDDEASDGDVLTREGEYLGTWTLIRDEPDDGGVLHFVEDGKSEPLFSEAILILSSGVHFGRAMSNLCASVRRWHESQ